MKFEVTIATARQSKLKTGSAVISVKMKEGEPSSLADAVAKAVRSNIGKHHVIKTLAPLQEGVEAAMVVTDRYGIEFPYLVKACTA